MIMWKWEWGGDIDHVLETSSEGIAINPDIASCSDLDEDESNKDESNDNDDPTSMSVMFKCIGTTHHKDAQDTLCIGSRLLNNNEHVPVELVPTLITANF